MMTRSQFFALPVLLATALGAPAQAEEDSIREFFTSYIEVFNKHDADSVAALWRSQATHVDLETGERREGREAVTSDLANLFEEKPDVRLAGSIDRIRVITNDVARVEGQTTVSTADAEPAVSAFTAILVKQEGNWLIDSVEEMTTPQPPTSYDALRDLEWLVGRWVDESDEARVDTTVRWSSNRAFLIRSFRVSLDGEAVQEGTQVIGWDPRAGQIRSWKFDSDGSFGDGIWSQSGEDWMIKSTQTLADGQAASGTFVLARIDDDALTLRLIGHEVEGEPVPKSEAVRMVRVIEQPASDASDPAKSEDQNAKPPVEKESRP